MALGALSGAGTAANAAAAASTAPSTASPPTRASFAARGRRQSEAPGRKRSVALRRHHAWTLKYHDFVPDTLDFSASRSFTSSKPEKFQ